MFFGHGNAQPAGFGQIFMEGMRVLAIAIARQPVIVGVLSAQGFNPRDQGFTFFS